MEVERTGRLRRMEEGGDREEVKGGGEGREVRGQSHALPSSTPNGSTDGHKHTGVHWRVWPVESTAGGVIASHLPPLS